MSSVVGGIIYTFFGTIKEISIGPTAMMSLLTNQYISDLSTEEIGLLSFGCACVALLFSVLRLGKYPSPSPPPPPPPPPCYSYPKNYFLTLFSPPFFGAFAGMVVEFISVPVSSAFGSSVAMTILGTEVKNFLGLEYANKSKNFFHSLYNFYIHVRDIRLGDMSLGIICVVILILLDVRIVVNGAPAVRPPPNFSSSTYSINVYILCLFFFHRNAEQKVQNMPIKKSWKHRDSIKKALWLIAMSRNAITIFLACILTKYFESHHGMIPYKLSGEGKKKVYTFEF